MPVFQVFKTGVGMSSIGFVTIGQSPRNDVLQSMLPGAEVSHCIQAGALDGVRDSEIERLKPDHNETPFVTRLRDGREVLVAKKQLMPFLQRAVDNVVDAGANMVIVLCTGAFPDLTASVPLIFPDNLLRANIDALLPAGRLGVIMPNEGQREMMLEKWTRPERQVVAIAESPYTDMGSPDSSATDELSTCDLVVLDCMGFDEEVRKAWHRQLGVPVILANRLIGRVLEEIDPTLAAVSPSAATAQSAD
jgi:protein AroM